MIWGYHYFRKHPYIYLKLNLRHFEVEVKDIKSGVLSDISLSKGYHGLFQA